MTQFNTDVQWQHLLIQYTLQDSFLCNTVKKEHLITERVADKENSCIGTLEKLCLG